MSPPRPAGPPPEAFILGAAGPEVRLPARLCRVLDVRALDRLRREVRGADSVLDSVLLAIHLVGLQWAAVTLGSEARKDAEMLTPSPWVDTATAADLLGITPRRVRQLINTKVLPAERRGDRWVLDREAIENERAARAA